MKKTITTEYESYESVSELSADEQSLLVLANEASDRAYAPYSNFYVGAAVLLENGEIITGNNQENVAYPSGLCAERVAIFAASSRFPGVPIKTIAITAHSSNVTLNSPLTPCGGCRQVIAEYETLQKKPIRLLLLGQGGGVIVVNTIEVFLPLMFKAEGLKKGRK